MFGTRQLHPRWHFCTCSILHCWAQWKVAVAFRGMSEVGSCVNGRTDTMLVGPLPMCLDHPPSLSAIGLILPRPLYYPNYYPLELYYPNCLRPKVATQIEHSAFTCTCTMSFRNHLCTAHAQCFSARYVHLHLQNAIVD